MKQSYFTDVDETKDNADQSNSSSVRYFLHPNKTLTWFCNLVKEATNRITKRDLKGISSFSTVPTVLNRQGPSQKIQVNLKTNSKKRCLLDLDLVVAFEFDVSFYDPLDTYHQSFRHLKYKEYQRPYLFVIPKIIQSKKQHDKEKEQGSTTKSESLHWRIDFHDQERIILDSETFPLAKPTIKILKLYKYVNALKLSSYLIKSTVMNIVVKENGQNIFRSGNKFDEAIIYTLKNICCCLETGKAPYLFDRKCNLFWKTSSDNLKYMNTKIKKDIERLKTGGTEAWFKLLTEKLPLVDDFAFVYNGSISHRSEAWKPHEKRNSEYQRLLRSLKELDESDEDEKKVKNLIQVAHISEPNRVVKRKTN